ncbi:MAG: metallopeptidase TldD-related protein [candidate division WOR-3 bacterium]|nr:metallopeptidase TldD-related protein [candidate division WOR-3 bacterium]
MKRFFILLMTIAGGVFAGNSIIQTMAEELSRSYKVLSKEKPYPVYFMQYEIMEEHQSSIIASLGVIIDEKEERNRYLDVDVRVGSYKLDNYHEIRGAEEYDWWSSPIEVPIDDHARALKLILWAETDKKFKAAQERYIKILNERQVKVLESDTSPDFSPAPKIVYSEKIDTLAFDRELWKEKLRNLSAVFKNHPWIYGSRVSLRATSLTKYLVNTEGTRLVHSQSSYSIQIYAETMADDGMELYLSYPVFARNIKDIPDDEILRIYIDSLIQNLYALRNAPMVEPYSGPAILMNRACGVFFHEIFGHRIEGHRQKSEFEGQTFTKKLNEKIMPDFISVYDDPTLEKFNYKDLNGHYLFDDEGVKAQKAVIVDNGVLKGFLMSRSPIAGFPVSNGHGRRQYGRKVVARQGVLYIKSTKEVPFEELRTNLIEECKKQNKPYGLIFYDIAGGFTMTGREGPQTFKVIPLFVKRIYVDGRPDEVVRGVDIVGTPLLSLSKIIMTGNDYDIFNGTCGAESGWVPVSAIAPSILVSEIEVEKKSKGQERPPILPAPIAPSE